jgi:hypothetical protein
MYLFIILSNYLPVLEDTIQHTSVIVDVIDDDMFSKMLVMYSPFYM